VKCNRPALAFLFLPLAVAPSLPAAILGARTLPPAPTAAVARVADASRLGRATPAWPRPAPPPPRRMVPRDDDDAPGRWLQLQFPAATLQLDAERLDDWLRVSEPTTHQLEWISRWSPSVRFGLSQAPAFLLPSLDDASWSRYLAALRREGAGPLELVVDDDSQRNTDMTRVLGARTRVLVYDVALPSTNGERHRITQVAVEFPRGVIVFACSGGADKVEAMSAVFQRLVVRAELAPGSG
jgi:hypothetical protein